MSTKNLMVLSLLASAFFCFSNSFAQAPKRKVPPVEIRDASNKPIMLPKLGEKHLFIFYADPDHANQNKQFIDSLERHPINSDKIFSFGIVNLKDAPMLPNGVVRMMLRKKVKSTGADIYTDPNHLLRDAWKLGDVNDKFAFIFVNKDRELEYFKAGELTPADRKRLMNVINKYR